jgi:hypothetical protein
LLSSYNYCIIWNLDNRNNKRKNRTKRRIGAYW